MSYLVFDIESVVDWDLAYQVEHEFGEPMDIFKTRYLDKLRKKQECPPEKTPFVPCAYQVPVSVAYVLCTDVGRYQMHKVVSTNASAKLIEDFWDTYRFVEKEFGSACFVSFNGKAFDMPLVEVNSLRCGVPMPEWLVLHPQYASDNPRNKYSNSSHLDLRELMYNGGAHLGGSLAYWCTIAGIPGKVCMDGSGVAELYEQKKFGDIGDYCLTDVLGTYALLVRILQCSSCAPVGGIDFHKTIGDMVDKVSQSPEAKGTCVSAWLEEYRAGRKVDAYKKQLDDDDDPPF